MGRLMLGSWNIGVVVPARNEEEHIVSVIETMHSAVDMVVVVNDGSTDNTRALAEAAKGPCPVVVIEGGGRGVGSAIDLGHRHLLSTLPKPFISVVMAGDGQMNPHDLPQLAKPVVEDRADHVKGNRRHHEAGYNGMPRHRQRASTVLGAFTTLASGVPVSDPQCGYTATSSKVLESWNWSKSWAGYGYPNFWWINLAREGWKCEEVPVESIYRNERSGIKKASFFASVGWMMAVEHHRRNLEWLRPPNPLPHSLFALLAYLLGWSAWLPFITNDLEQALVLRGIPVAALAMMFWTVAHVFDRLAARARQELKQRAKT